MRTMPIESAEEILAEARPTSPASHSTPFFSQFSAVIATVVTE